MTNADVACANAVRALIKKTRHLWCTWHIIENIHKTLLQKIGKQRYQAMMALFHDVRKECNEQSFHRQWNALLDAYPDAPDCFESTWGKEKFEYWATLLPLGVLHSPYSEFSKGGEHQPVAESPRQQGSQPLQREQNF